MTPPPQPRGRGDGGADSVITLLDGGPVLSKVYSLLSRSLPAHGSVLLKGVSSRNSWAAAFAARAFAARAVSWLTLVPGLLIPLLRPQREGYILQSLIDGIWSKPLELAK